MELVHDNDEDQGFYRYHSFRINNRAVNSYEGRKADFNDVPKSDHLGRLGRDEQAWKAVQQIWRICTITDLRQTILYPKSDQSPS